MPILECTNCGKTFKKWVVKPYAWLGPNQAGVSLGIMIPLWPFVLRVYTECPNCGKITWIKVLKPRFRSK